MIDRLNKSIPVKKVMLKNINNTTDINPKNTVSNSLVDEIISEIKLSKKEITTTLVQHHIVLKTLINSLGDKATQEPKFKELYQFISNKMSKDDNVQQLIINAITLHKL